MTDSVTDSDAMREVTEGWLAQSYEAWKAQRSLLHHLVNSPASDGVVAEGIWANLKNIAHLNRELAEFLDNSGDR